MIRRLELRGIPKRDLDDRGQNIIISPLDRALEELQHVIKIWQAVGIAVEDVEADGEDAGGFVIIEIFPGVEAECERRLGEREWDEAAIEADGHHDGQDSQLADGFADDGVDAGI